MLWGKKEGNKDEMWYVRSYPKVLKPLGPVAAEAQT